jgi:hypothetical protein
LEFIHPAKRTNLTFLILMTISIATADNPSKENLSDKDAADIFCSKINMDADDVTYQVVDLEPNTIALNWKNVFKKDNVESLGGILNGRKRLDGLPPCK